MSATGPASFGNNQSGMFNNTSKPSFGDVPLAPKTLFGNSMHFTTIPNTVLKTKPILKIVRTGDADKAFHSQFNPDPIVVPNSVLGAVPKKLSTENKIKQMEERLKKSYNDIKQKEEETKELHELIKRLDTEKEKLVLYEKKKQLNHEIILVINAFTMSKKSTVDDLTKILNYVNEEFNTKIANLVEQSNDNDEIMDFDNSTVQKKRIDNPSSDQNTIQKKQRENE